MSKHIHPLSQAIMTWFDLHHRDLPWRKSYDPYHVWISEIMLQQTQMQRGAEYFTKWIERFPNLSALAEAKQDDVFKAWEGLGYYSRARNLHDAAKIIKADHLCRIPSDPTLLATLPGIGPYTAAAIASIAFQQDVCVIDANVERVISRLFDIGTPIKARETQNQLHTICTRLLPQGEARKFNQAVMEFGALLCRPKNPECARCPVHAHCQAAHRGVQAERPRKAEKARPVYITMATGVLVHNQRVFIQKRNSHDVWGDLWEFPGGVVETNESPAETVIREFLEETSLNVSNPRFIGTFKHNYTKYRITMHAFFVHLKDKKLRVNLHAAQEYQWTKWEHITSKAFPSGHKKLIATLDENIFFLEESFE